MITTTVRDNRLTQLDATMKAYEAPSGAWIYVIRTTPKIPEMVMVWERDPGGDVPPFLVRLGFRYEACSDAEAIDEALRIRAGAWPRHECLQPRCPCEDGEPAQGEDPIR